MRITAALLTLALLAPLPAAAVEHRHHHHEADCKDSIRAAGDAFHLIRAAKKSAIKRWQEQVINAHGERYMNYTQAKVVDIHCDPARVGGGDTVLDLKRCVVVARPCKNDTE